MQNGFNGFPTPKPDKKANTLPPFYTAATDIIPDGSSLIIDVGFGRTFAACQSNSGSPFAVRTPNWSASAANASIALFNQDGTTYVQITNNTTVNTTFKVSAK